MLSFADCILLCLPGNRIPGVLVSPLDGMNRALSGFRTRTSRFGTSCLLVRDQSSYARVSPPPAPIRDPATLRALALSLPSVASLALPLNSEGLEEEEDRPKLEVLVSCLLGSRLPGRLLVNSVLAPDFLT
jgi:hypothetical protein